MPTMIRSLDDTHQFTGGWGGSGGLVEDATHAWSSLSLASSDEPTKDPKQAGYNTVTEHTHTESSCHHPRL